MKTGWTNSYFKKCVNFDKNDKNTSSTPCKEVDLAGELILLMDPNDLRFCFGFGNSGRSGKKMAVEQGDVDWLIRPIL